MATQTPNLYDAVEATPFENGARFDISHDRAENMVPAGEYFDRQRELAQLAKAAGDAADHGLAGYAAEGIEQLEHYANQPTNPEMSPEEAAIAFLRGVSKNIADARAQEIEISKR